MGARFDDSFCLLPRELPAHARACFQLQKVQAEFATRLSHIREVTLPPYGSHLTCASATTLLATRKGSDFLPLASHIAVTSPHCSQTRINGAWDIFYSDPRTELDKAHSWVVRRARGGHVPSTGDVGPL